MNVNIAKDCLFTGQDQACYRIDRFFGQVSPCRKRPITQENGCWLPLSNHRWYLFPDQEGGIIGQTSLSWHWVGLVDVNVGVVDWKSSNYNRLVAGWASTREDWSITTPQTFTKAPASLSMQGNVLALICIYPVNFCPFRKKMTMYAKLGTGKACRWLYAVYIHLTQPHINILGHSLYCTNSENHRVPVSFLWQIYYPIIQWFAKFGNIPIFYSKKEKHSCKKEKGQTVTKRTALLCFLFQLFHWPSPLPAFVPRYHRTRQDNLLTRQGGIARQLVLLACGPLHRASKCSSACFSASPLPPPTDTHLPTF